MIHPEDILSMTDFKRDTAASLKRLKTTGRPGVLTVNGRAAAVVLSPDAYADLVELADRMEAIEGVRRGLADVEAGRTTPLATALERVRRSPRARRRSA